MAACWGGFSILSDLSYKQSGIQPTDKRASHAYSGVIFGFDGLPPLFEFQGSKSSCSGSGLPPEPIASQVSGPVHWIFIFAKMPKQMTLMNHAPDTVTRPNPQFLRIALGIIFFHFGFLKFYPDLSPAEMIASQTVMRLSGGTLDAKTAMWWLALLESGIGIGFLLNIWPRIVSGLFLLHMIGTFMPLFVLPEIAFKIGPFAPTLEGQYIMKNIVFVAAGWTVLWPNCRWSRRADTSVPIPSHETTATIASPFHVVTG